MFPLNSNQPYIKETGERSTLGAVLESGGGGSSELPEYSAANAGQVLTIDNSGNLAWEEVASGGFIVLNNSVEMNTPTTDAEEVTT